MHFFFFSYVVNETIGVLNLVAYRDAGTYGNVSLFFYAQNLEAQLGLDFNATPSVSHKHSFLFLNNINYLLFIAFVVYIY